MKTWINKAKLLINKHIIKVVGATSGVSILQFLGNLYNYSSDGDLTAHEVKQLLLSASGVEVILVGVVIIYLQINKDDSKNKPVLRK